MCINHNRAAKKVNKCVSDAIMNNKQQEREEKAF